MTPTASPVHVEEGSADHPPWEVPHGMKDERHRRGTSGFPRGTRGSRTAAPVLATGTIWAALTAVKAILLVQQGHRAGMGMSAFQPWPAETASLIGLLLALPIVISAERRSRSAASRAASLRALLFGWALFSLIHLAVTLTARQVTVGLDELYAFASPRAWLLQLGESTLAYFLALAVFALFRSSPSRVQASGRPENAAPPRSGASPPDHVVRLSDGGRDVDVRVRDLVAVSGGGNYIELVFRDGSRKLFRCTLNAAQAALEPLGFRRTHKSWLVRLGAVTDAARTSSGEYRLDLGGGLDAPLSRRNRPLLEEMRGKPSTNVSTRQRKRAAEDILGESTS